MASERYLRGFLPQSKNCGRTVVDTVVEKISRNNAIYRYFLPQYHNTTVKVSFLQRKKVCACCCRSHVARAHFFFRYMCIKNCGRCGNVVDLPENGVRTRKNLYHNSTTLRNCGRKLWQKIVVEFRRMASERHLYQNKLWQKIVVENGDWILPHFYHSQKIVVDFAETLLQKLWQR